EVGHRDRQAAVQIKRLRHIADHPSLIPANADVSRMRHLPEKRAHQGGLATAIGADDAVDRTGAHGETHAIENARVAQDEADLVEFDRGSAHLICHGITGRPEPRRRWPWPAW